MTKEDIILKLTEIVKGINKKIKDIKLTDNLYTDLNLDSISLVCMAIVIEKEFNINLDDVSFNDFKIAEDVVNYIERKVNNEK